MKNSSWILKGREAIAFQQSAMVKTDAGTYKYPCLSYKVVQMSWWMQHPWLMVGIGSKHQRLFVKRNVSRYLVYYTAYTTKKSATPVWAAALGSAARGEVQLDLLNSSFSRGASKLLLLVSLLRSTSPLSQGDGVPWFSPPKKLYNLQSWPRNSW